MKIIRRYDKIKLDSKYNKLFTTNLVVFLRKKDAMQKGRQNNNSHKLLALLFSAIIFLFIITVTYYHDDINQFLENLIPNNTSHYQIENIPEYHGKSYITINDNEPMFSEEDYASKQPERYSNLDPLGRCKVAFAKVGIDTMPTEKRGSIGMIKPSGWHTVKYDIINGKYLYNRCHLIGYQLTGENANPKNLITCTRSMNTTGMLEFENKVANYVRETKNHVLYRVTPIFQGDNLIASGVEMEAKSIEDNGKGISFHVYVYNVQEGIEINYKTGESKLKKN